MVHHGSWGVDVIALALLRQRGTYKYKSISMGWIVASEPSFFWAGGASWRPLGLETPASTMTAIRQCP